MRHALTLMDQIWYWIHPEPFKFIWPRTSTRPPSLGLSRLSASWQSPFPIPTILYDNSPSEGEWCLQVKRHSCQHQKLLICVWCDYIPNQIWSRFICIISWQQTPLSPWAQKQRWVAWMGNEHCIKNYKLPSEAVQCRFWGSTMPLPKKVRTLCKMFIKAEYDYLQFM